ncbi:hypothetical protein OV207_17600 [Corallococcus sp. BB11-1]|uniref:hypothetical protein n=1 Tax=Corallococcus sp. BB11-1 TaxID=2996783 RepID=UPI00226F662F|nr:hypothetical protein [Corallococcus sp. BB11-1]MCY1033273.1 hypothetical protein [Corallococcus sp. BB11-1]
MNQDESLQALRKVVAEAILLGTKVADKPYGGNFWDEGNRPYWEGLRRLHQLTAEFLAASGLKSLSPEDVFPVHEEMKRISESRS